MHSKILGGMQVPTWWVAVLEQQHLDRRAGCILLRDGAGTAFLVHILNLIQPKPWS